MVEIAQNHYQAFVLLSEHVSGRYLDIVEGNVGSTGGRGVGRFDRLGLNTRASLNKENCKAFLRLACNGEVVAEVAVCNPPEGRTIDCQCNLVWVHEANQLTSLFH